MKLTYWAEGNYEVDYIVELNNHLFAIEVKSGKSKNAKSLTQFLQQYKNAIPIFISNDNIENFLVNPKNYLLSKT